MRGLFTLFILSCAFSVFAQDIVYNISAKNNNTATALDSILIENLSNNTHVLFNNLAEQDSYEVNLSQKKVVTGITNLNQDEQFRILKNVAGEVSISFFSTLYGNATVQLVNTQGQVIYKNKINISNQNNTFNIKVQQPGLHILTFSTLAKKVSIKVMGDNTSGQVIFKSQKAYSDLAYQTTKSASIYTSNNFSFQDGDNITISVFKDDYYIEPANLVIKNSENVNFILEAPLITQKVNKFMWDAMQDVYLWYNEIPDVDYQYEEDSYAFFDTLLVEEDRWSYTTDDVEALQNSFEGKEKSYGWSLTFGLFSNTGNVFAIVEFVYPNTPASEAGVERGDIIVLMNGADITIENYTDLLYGESTSINRGILGDGGISTDTETVSLTARELTLNPVVKTSVVEHEGHKIGYLLYAQYISNYNDALDTTFQSMIDQGVTDMVIDLRYNPGGTISAASHMCSALAPLDVVNNNSTLVTFRWNDKYQDYFTNNQITSQLEVYFDKEAPVKMGLNSIHFLTGPGSASASELTITGLKPYMSVTTVGETTHGKYTASITLAPEDIYNTESYYEEIDNWAIQPIVIQYANSEGVTDFKDGFTPDIEVEDDLFSALPLGTKSEPLFKAAIEHITGTTLVMKSAQKVNIPHTIFDRGFSIYDRNKREVLIDNIDFKLKK